MKWKAMKEKAKIAVLCGIFLAVALLIGGVVFAWKSTFKGKKDEETTTLETSVSEEVKDVTQDSSATDVPTEEPSSETESDADRASMSSSVARA